MSIWQALTDPTLHAQWWVAGDVRTQQGHHFILDMGPWGVQHCEVTAIETERLYAFTFAIGTLDTTITWYLEPEAQGNKTQLTLEHKGFNLDNPQGMVAFEGMSKGWPSVLARLEALLSSAEVIRK
jgi:uncharacterized protein YndB with AHSA1/START domain